MDKRNNELFQDFINLFNKYSFAEVIFTAMFFQTEFFAKANDYIDVITNDEGMIIKAKEEIKK